MNDTSKQIEQIIDQAVTEKVFSLDIIEKIKGLKDDFEDAQDTIKVLQEQNKEHRENNKGLCDSNNALRDLLGKATATIDIWQAKEKHLDAREKALYQVEMRAAYHEDRATEIKELFGIVFKNPVIKETVFKNTDTPIASGNGMYPSNYRGSETTETKTEVE